ncbi:MAG TPA: FMN-binding protein [Planctomycetes bacterium]|nr:FMN-binding protein [Planctomycetota bacterium]
MLKNVKYFAEQSWLLIAASFVFGLLLAVTNTAWGPMIEQNEINKFNNLASLLLTDASFETALKDVEVDSGKGKKIKTSIKKGVSRDSDCVGWAFVCEGSGFADKIKLVLTVDAAFEKLAGFGVLASNETPGFGDKIKGDYYRNQFVGAPAAQLVLSKTGDDKIIDNEIVAITGATVSSEAVVKTVNNYIKQIKTCMQTEGLLNNAE